MNPDLSKLEEAAFSEDDFSEVPPTDIVAYNELRSCADLFRMHEQGILEIQPDFQRDIVWRGPDQTRFIDSLIKQLPIPSMCFAMDHKAQRWMVIDGLQRIATIVRFLEGGDWKLSKLDDIEPEIGGKSVAAIKTSETKLRHYYNPAQVSNWERYFYGELYKAGLKPIPQYQVEKYDLDFALFDGSRRLDIEVDGERYHKAWNGELVYRDQLRNMRLIELGWDVMRFWVYEIRDDLEGCIDRIRGWTEQDPMSKMTLETNLND